VTIRDFSGLGRVLVSRKMKLFRVSGLGRRTILIYIVTIVVPAGILLYLGIKTFELQRRNLATLKAEKVDVDVKEETLKASEVVFAGGTHPIAQYWFEFENGEVLRPALRSGWRRDIPSEFAEAEREELSEEWHKALASYRALARTETWKALALAGVARCLEKLERMQEARALWRDLALSYPDDRDPSGRPYGIVANISAKNTAGLYEKIESGRWELSGDVAEFLLTTLDPQRKSAYLQRFEFARELEEQFQPQANLRENITYESRFGDRFVLYRTDAAGKVTGFSVDQEWVAGTLLPQLQRKAGLNDVSRPELVYGGAIALAILIVSAGVLVLLRDVSREARTNRLRSDFVSSVSHELKTPITLIRLYSETLLRHGTLGLGEQERSDFQGIIVRESERLTRLIDQVLTFSRVERGDQTYNLEAGDVAPVIAEIVDDYRELLERSGFSLKRALPDSTPMVRFDPTALTRAVVNLLDNAVKYSGDSREIEVRLDVRGADVAFEVADHGVGIPASEHQKIFERFYRVDNGNGKGGYGLGLYLVRHVMDAHGGRAEVDSEPGRGSRFRLILPVVTEWANSASS